jgi:hypothetical protein
VVDDSHDALVRFGANGQGSTASSISRTAVAKPSILPRWPVLKQVWCIRCRGGGETRGGENPATPPRLAYHLSEWGFTGPSVRGLQFAWASTPVPTSFSSFQLQCMLTHLHRIVSNTLPFLEAIDMNRRSAGESLPVVDSDCTHMGLATDSTHLWSVSECYFDATVESSPADGMNSCQPALPGSSIRSFPFHWPEYPKP